MRDIQIEALVVLFLMDIFQHLSPEKNGLTIDIYDNVLVNAIMPILVTFFFPLKKRQDLQNSGCLKEFCETKS